MGGTEPVQWRPSERRFEEFFVQDSYVALKNYLYNYLERKRAINRALEDEPELVLEVGSGLSPIITGRENVIYSELSFRALRTLKELNGQGHYVAADGTRLPFASSSVSHVICSEVLEHVEDDQAAIDELARVLKIGGLAYITVPHRRFYFAADDRYVHHFRRYEIEEMTIKLENAGLRLRRLKKVLGPLEKVTMFSVVMLFSAMHSISKDRNAAPGRTSSTGTALRSVLHPVFKWAHRGYAVLARVDAWVMPRALATVMLFEAVKDEG
ncbi:MAG: methyltransferase domain-containing protein [Candidatus Hydrogenedentes bacterium]|nr:methyltransferase domain-containing protein [Candidatus Hydrogenedentota bacterium]